MKLLVETSNDLQVAAELLWSCRVHKRHINRLPAALRPVNKRDAYAIQAGILQFSKAPLFGWKIAATSPAGQAHLGLNEPIAGRLLAEGILRSGAECSLEANMMRCAESEFAFRFSQSLNPRCQPFSIAEVLECVEDLLPAIEVPDTRYSRLEVVGAEQLIADNACDNILVLGDPAPSFWRELDLNAHDVISFFNDDRKYYGTGANVMGDPLRALQWLVNELSDQGIAIEAGQIVTTGACVPPQTIAPGDHIVTNFGSLGEVSVRII